MLSKGELYNEIIRLRQEGKTYREISKILHVSPSQISAALKEFEGTDTEPSIQTKAYKMFLKGKRPIDAAIKLRIGNEQATKLWKEYIELMGHYRLLKIYEELGRNFVPFVNAYYAIKRRCLTLGDIQKVVNRDRDIGDELARKELLMKELDEQINEKNTTLSNLNKEINILSIVKMVITEVLRNLTNEKKRLELFLSYNKQYSYERNNNLIHIPYRPIGC